jgi:hypothetical protein
VQLDELLMSERRPEAGVLRADDVEHLVAIALRQASVAGLATARGHEAFGPGLNERIAQPLHLANAQAQVTGDLPLRGTPFDQRPHPVQPL